MSLKNIIEIGIQTGFSVCEVSILLLVSEILFILLLCLCVRKKYDTGIGNYFTKIIISIFNFFKGIINSYENSWALKFTLIMFFFILTLNFIQTHILLLGVCFKFFENITLFPLYDISFNIVIILSSISIIIFEKLKSIGFRKAMCVNMFNTKYITYRRIKTPSYIHWLRFAVIKVIDIVILILMGIFKILAKSVEIIYLSLKLFFTKTSKSMQFCIFFIGAAALSTYILGFDFPMMLPIILYLRGLFYALIQAIGLSILLLALIKTTQTH